MTIFHNQKVFSLFSFQADSVKKAYDTPILVQSVLLQMCLETTTGLGIDGEGWCLGGLLCNGSTASVDVHNQGFNNLQNIDIDN